MLETLVAPTETAISIFEAKAYLRIAQDGDDVSLLALIKAAIERVEARHFIALVRRVARQSFSSVEINRAFAFAKMKNQKPILRPDLTPISTIISIKSKQFDGQLIENNNLITFFNNVFEINNFADSIEIEYWAGFENANSVPNSYKLLVLEELARIIEVRENEALKSDSFNFLGARI